MWADRRVSLLLFPLRLTGEATLELVRLVPGSLEDHEALAEAEASISREIRRRSLVRWAKACNRPLLRSSAHSLWAPATCETCNVTPLAELQEAIRRRNSERGQEVVNSLFTPPSVGVLSLSEGKQRLKRVCPKWALAVIASASWAIVSKHAMSLVRKGHMVLISSMV